MLLKQKYYGWLLVLSTLILSACGFQLRGQATIPPALHNLTLVMDSEPASFARDVRIALSQAGIRVLDPANASSDIHELKINPLSIKDTVLARAADNDATQIEKRLSVTYFIRDEQGKSLSGPRSVSTSLILNHQGAEQSSKSAYNAELTQRAQKRLAQELIYDLSQAPL